MSVFKRCLQATGLILLSMALAPPEALATIVDTDQPPGAAVLAPAPLPRQEPLAPAPSAETLLLLMLQARERASLPPPFPGGCFNCSTAPGNDSSVQNMLDRAHELANPGIPSSPLIRVK